MHERVRVCVCLCVLCRSERVRMSGKRDVGATDLRTLTREQHTRAKKF